MFTHTAPPKFEELECVTTSKGRWYTTPNGTKLASVTTILGSKPKPWLDAWRTSLGPKKADKETKRCSERGEAVHLMAEHYLNNIDNVTKKQSPENIKMFNQLKIRLNKIDNIRAQEIPLYSETLKIAGRVDCVGEYDNTLSIIDFKTSNGNKDEKMVHDYKIQCTMYALCWYEMYGELIEDYVVLIAVERGIMPLVFRGKTQDHMVEAAARIEEYHNKVS